MTLWQRAPSGHKHWSSASRSDGDTRACLSPNPVSLPNGPAFAVGALPSGSALPCAAPLCRTTAVPLPVNPAPSPCSQRHHPATTTTTTNTTTRRRSPVRPAAARPAAEPNLHPTPHTCLHAHRSAARRGRGGPKVDGASKHGWTREEDEAVVAMVLTAGQKRSTLSKGWRYGGASAHYILASWGWYCATLPTLTMPCNHGPHLGAAVL